MAPPESSSPSTDHPLTFFQALSFDVYATLIDWESGIYVALEPLNSRLPSSHASKSNRRALLQIYTRLEGELEHAHPDMNYSELLGLVYAKIAQELGISLEPDRADDEKAAFGASVGIWPAFPDTVAALKKLAKHYKLIVLSNVNREAFEKTRTGPLQSVKFDAVYTAQEIGSYKPDPRNFEYLIEHTQQDLGVEGERILHTAQALRHDHVPALKAGLRSCWIERAGEEAVIGGRLQDFGEEVRLDFRFKTLGEMADAAEKAFETVA